MGPARPVLDCCRSCRHRTSDRARGHDMGGAEANCSPRSLAPRGPGVFDATDARRLRREVDRCRSMINRPFAVNLTILPSVCPPNTAEYRRAIIDSGIKIIETAAFEPHG